MRQLARYRVAWSLVLVSALACGMLVARVGWSGRRTFLFLGWNLVLAWVPYTVSLVHARLARGPQRRWGLLAAATAIWLAFFPNAPYLVTDLVHLKPRPPVPHWYDVGMLATFAWAGIFLAVYSLRNVHRAVERHVGSVAGWLFVGTTAGLAGLGAYMGRFLRWNSWDLAYRPHQLAPEFARRAIQPLEHPRLYGFSLVVGALLFACYVAVTAGARKERA